MPEVSDCARNLDRCASKNCSHALLHVSSPCPPPSPLCCKTKVLYDLLFYSAIPFSKSLATGTPRAQIGFFSSAHLEPTTQSSPHVHCVVPAAALSRSHPLDPRTRNYSSQEVLRKVFRGSSSALPAAFQNGQLNFHADLKLLANPRPSPPGYDTVSRKVGVYLKPPFGGPLCAAISRPYTHRVPSPTTPVSCPMAMSPFVGRFR